VLGFSVCRVVVGGRRYWVVWIEGRTGGIGIEVVGVVETGIVEIVVVGIAETIDTVEIDLVDAIDLIDVIEVDYFDIFLETEIVGL
jgi:hypothetical protein